MEITTGSQGRFNPLGKVDKMTRVISKYAVAHNSMSFKVSRNEEGSGESESKFMQQGGEWESESKFMQQGGEWGAESKFIQQGGEWGV